MSLENTLVDTPGPEPRFSNVIYEEFINNVKRSWEFNESETEPVKVKKTNAEDEVAAILLSAMMGSIVQEWEGESSSPEVIVTKKSSEDSKAQEQISLGVVETEDDTSEVTVESKKKTVLSKISRVPTTSTQAFNEEEYLVQDKRETFGSGFSRSHSEHTALQSGEFDEEQDSIRLEELKELLINDKEKIYGWEFLQGDQEFIIKFKRGNMYQGKLLNCRMHGEGKFHWADGSVYEGKFVLGEMTGPGKLYLPDGSWYEGELCKGYRHGRGLYVWAPTFYAGYWKRGRRHGMGAMFYSHFNTDRHYYNGEWTADKKHGTGLRCYPSGAMYSGQWREGRRHGLGTMVWTNRDVYSGNFRRGKMHGYGEYTWDTFFNRQLVVPVENCYYGNWRKNVRHGNGTLETTTGVIVKGSWKRGKKHGAAEVICSNGNFLYADDLFDEDNIVLSDSNMEADSLMNASLQSVYRLPVSAACHEINLGYYVVRLVEFIGDCDSYGKPFCSEPTSPVKFDPKRTFSFNRRFEPEANKFDFNEEETYTRNVLMQFLSTLKVIYTSYSQVCCDQKPSFPTILMRLMWWQLLRDCNLHAKGFSLADFDICIANNKACLVQSIHYPFERLLFWQFLHCLIEVSWELYGKKCEGTSTVKGIIASGLHKLITTDLVPNVGRHKGNALFGYRELLSFDSLYWYYRGVGEPHSARHFLKQAVVPQEDSGGGPPDYQEYQVRGRNVIGVGGKLTYFPDEEPLLSNEKYREDPTHPKNLSCLSSLGLLTILDCILQVCPSIYKGEFLVNMDYKIVFLEFYEILLLCASKKAKIKISERKLKEEEEEATNAVPSSPAEPVENPLSPPQEDLPPPPESSGKRKKSSGSKKPKKKK